MQFVVSKGILNDLFIAKNKKLPHRTTIPQFSKSIAVLPFINMSADPDNEYFSDGITEEIINALTTIQGLKVISRTSSFAFKGKNIDVRIIGTQLGVQTILEGSVRKVKNNVRITAQLINTKDGVHLWSKNFDRQLADIFALQDEVSLLIADQIRENFGHFDIQEQLVEIPTQNVEAYNLYLKGRYHHLKWNAKDILLGTEYYKQSIELDPSFALPYFGVGLCSGINASWGFIPYESGIQEASQYLAGGLQLAANSYIGNFAQATISFWGKWEYKAGHYYLNKSLQLNPSFTEAEEALAELYTVIGEFEKALYHTQHILKLNPLSPNHYFTQGNIHYLSKDYNKAIESMTKALQVDPNFALAIEMIAVCYIHLKDYQKLVTFLENQPAEKPKECLALYQLIHEDENIPVDTEEIRAAIMESADSSLIPWSLYFNVYLGNQEIALDMLTAGIQRKKGQFINFKSDPFLEPLHSTNRFKKLIATTFHPSRLPDMDLDVIQKAIPTKSVLNKEETNQYLAKMTDLLEKEQLYLDSNLNLKALADQINLHPNKLSWLLNDQIGKNFNEYINTFRLTTFKQKALNPANNHLTLLGLAYESGFNSKTVFNTFFKKTEGMTPRNWVKHNTQK